MDHYTAGEDYLEKKSADKNYHVRIHFQEQGEDIANRVTEILKDVYIREYLKRREVKL